MPIPVKAKCFTYTPDLLKEVEGAPSFTLCYGTRDQRYTYQELLTLKKLRKHGQDDFRRAVLSELRLDWDTEGGDIEVIVDLIERYYEADSSLVAMNDQWVAQALKTRKANPDLDDKALRKLLPLEPEIDMDAREVRRAEMIINEVEDKSDVMARMKRDNLRYSRMTGRCALAVLLQETNLEIKIKRDREGVISEETISEIDEALGKLCAKHAPDEFDGTAFKQLCDQAMMAFVLSEEEEKNSELPSPTSSDQNGSTKPDLTPSTTKASGSKAAAEAHTPEKSQAQQIESLSASCSEGGAECLDTNGQTDDPSSTSQ
jgi:hypothetical protein